ncbi:GGDEF domain-containing protein [Pseudohoeflea coraliihabitans]|uniref:diguanylate cyclase n=1 Tax=Pseudohoeflea coraliihabitans TaxID=2860393 RepID=A0ABS6WIK4_9HYPH|nr:diguanylate cyclase [Pseudohoeflea sp. DP4N28-3]MBW3095779.1 diguanylate cyclase [Pseudohoeflea sp. DP4N28-3]
MARRTKRKEKPSRRASGVDIVLVDRCDSSAAFLAYRLGRERGVSVSHCADAEGLAAVLSDEAKRYVLAVVDLDQPRVAVEEVCGLLSAHGLPTLFVADAIRKEMRDFLACQALAGIVEKAGSYACEDVFSAILRLLDNREVGILLVGEKSAACSRLAIRLGHQMHPIATAESASEAMAHLDADARIGVMVLDLAHSEDGGAALLGQIRERSKLQTLRIIGLGAAGTKDQAIAGLKAGADEVIVEPFTPEEFDLRLNRHVRTAQQTRCLRDLAERDFLTGLYNRRHFFDEGPRRVAAAHAAVPPIPLALALIDLDHFKRLNDSYGHDLGDQVLREVASRLKQQAGTTHLVARLGGEEFGMLLSGLPLQEARTFCDAICQSFAEIPIATECGALTVTVSIGLAKIDGVAMFDRNLNAADRLLYIAKHQGRSQVICEGEDDSCTAVA